MLFVIKRGAGWRTRYSPRRARHAEVVTLKGDSYRLKDRDLGRVPASSTEET